MGKETQNAQEHAYEGLIPVRYARDAAEAEFYRALLEDHEIPVSVVGESGGQAKGADAAERNGIAILVSEEHAAEAEDIIEQRTALDDEFDDDLEAYDANDDDDDDMFTQLVDVEDDDLDDLDESELMHDDDEDYL